MGKRSNGTRGTNSSNSSRSRKFNGGGVEEYVDKIAFNLYGSTKAVSVDNVFKNKYKKEVAEEVRNSVEYESVFSKPKGDIETVSVSRLHPTQQYLVSENLKNISKIEISEDNLPMGVLRNGKVYVVDGHHRIAADIIKGRRKVRIRLRKEGI